MSRNQLRERVELLSDLRQIVQAMKNVAFAELQRISRALPALAEARRTVTEALSSLPEPRSSSRPIQNSGPGVCLAIGADRGFCGAFNARLSSRVEELRRSDLHLQVLIAGHRLAELMDGGATQIATIAGCSSIEDADPVLEDWQGAFDRAASSGRDFRLLYNSEEGIVQRRLLPVPEMPREAVAAPLHELRIGTPLTYLPLPVLRRALVRQAVRLVAQTSLFQSLEQENRARLVQMQLAQDHLDELGRKLRRRSAALRQSEITNELEILMTSIG